MTSDRLPVRLTGTGRPRLLVVIDEFAATADKARVQHCTGRSPLDEVVNGFVAAGIAEAPRPFLTRTTRKGAQA